MENSEKNVKKEKPETNEAVKEEEKEGKEEKEEEKESKELEDLRNELGSYKDKFLRMAAEYENFRKRTEKEKAAIYSDATVMTLQSILPVADSLEQALKSLESASEEYKKGIQMVSNQLNTALEKLGVESFGKAGDEFNPDLHNAVSHIDDENEKENVISGVYQTGYKVNDRVIRHAMVQVTN